MTLNTIHNAVIVKKGNIKAFHLTNSNGIKTSDVLDFSFAETNKELLPIYDFAKWIQIREDIYAYLEINKNGHFKLSRFSRNVDAGIWIAVYETYL